jgi:uncharacterized membrane protein YhhN
MIIRDNRKIRFITKPVSVALIIAVFLTQIDSLAWPVWIFLLGLVLGLCGDILLMLPKDIWFLAGLGSFLLGHVAYIIGFFSRGIVDPWWAAIMLLIPVVGIIILALRPIMKVTEKEMKASVLAYGIVIGTMLWSAIALFFKSAWNPTAAILAVTGASLFVTSDTMLAVWKFMKKNTEFWPMVTYHLAQMAIAAAVILQFNQ